MNICAKCRFYAPTESNHPADWANLCSAFDDEVVPSMDPVLGVEGFATVGTLGQHIFHQSIEQARPTCRSKNPNGECGRYRKAT